MPHSLLLSLRTAALLGGCGVAAAAAWSLAAPPLDAALHAGRAVGFAELVTAACAAALLLCVAWLLATTTLAVISRVLLELAPGQPAARAAGRLVSRWSPSSSRRLVGLALGVAVGAGVAGPAAGDTGLGGLPVPDRTSGSVVAGSVPRIVPSHAMSEVVVRPGDSLWSIAAALLGADADADAITRAWHLLHRLNTERVGDDPDLILPGTRLVVPERIAPHGKEAQ